MPDKQRMAWIEAALNGENLDAVICALPPYVLLLEFPIRSPDLRGILR